MKLLEVTVDGEAIVNKPWISLIPELQNLFRDSQNKIKYSNPKGRKYLSYMYLVLDFSSPLREWKEADRLQEAQRIADLTEEDIKSPKLKAAMEYYSKLLYHSCRAYKSYQAAKIGLDKMDEYFTTIDFAKTDKQGKLLYTPNQYIDNIAKTNKAYDELSKLATRIETEMTNSSGIRGLAEMGDKELQRSKGQSFESDGTSAEWSEDSTDADAPVALIDIMDRITGKN